MRLLIDSGDDTLVIHDRTPPWTDALVIRQDGLGDGMLGTPAPKEDTTDNPLADGAFPPATLHAGTRSMTLEVFARCASSVAAARLRDRINAISCKPLTIRRTDPAGERTITGYLADDPLPAITDVHKWTTFEATLTILCPDPLWHGPETLYTVNGRTVRVENNGNAPSWPVLHATGATRVDAGCDGHRIVWENPDPTDADIDLSTLDPDAGTLSAFDAFAIPPGGATIDVSVEPDGATLQVGVRGAWR